MVTATQIIPPEVDSSAQPGNQGVSDTGDLFKALFSALSLVDVPEKGSKENKNSSKDGGQNTDPSMQAVTMELISALLQNACPPAAESGQKPVTEGAAVADVLEGIGSSGGMDIATLMPGLQNAADVAAPEQGEETEDVKARMPQIMELLNATVTSTEKETEVSPDDRPCPLENVSETAVAGGGMLSGAAADGGTVSRAAGSPENSAQPVLTDEGIILPAGSPQTTADGANTQDSADMDGEEKRAEPETPERRTQNISGSPEPASAPVAPKLSSPPPQAPPAAATVQNSVANALQELEKVLTSYDGQDSKQFHIQLEPENLGKLSISLFMGRDGLTARIGTQSAEVQSVLAGQVNQLISKLDSSGIQVQRMDVFCSDSGQQQNPDFSNGGYARQRYDRRTGITCRKTDPEEIETRGLYMQLEDSNSSVEYLI